MNKLVKLTMAVLSSGFFAQAFANDATAMFQWAGTVPAAPISNGATIVQKGSVSHDAGTLIFQESTTLGEYNIVDSSTLSFGVKVGANDATSFDYEIKNLKFSYGGGLMNEVGTTPEFTIKANGADLVKNNPITGAVGDINLQVSNPTPINFVKGGDEVVIQATVLVSNAI